jgi:GWxTD domain-containing protein
VSNFEEALELIRYIASDSELEAMAGAEPGEQRALWDAFWSARDPVPATPANEYRDTFFERIRTATVQFGEPGRTGWRTARGEVYIVLGPPTRAAEMEYDMYGAGPARAQEWMYDRVAGGGDLRLVFVDRTGFGVYQLTPASESAFRAAAQRVKARVERR